MKLYLTLEDDDGKKVERVLGFTSYEITANVEAVTEDMVSSLEESKKPL